jgi:truncated hemoglobin YjbI
MATTSVPMWYERLGGVYPMASVVDDFIDRIMSDPRLNANPLVDEAHHRVTPPGFTYLVTEMVCWATGGPQQYTGRSYTSRTSICGSPRPSGTPAWMISNRRWTRFTSLPPSGRN